MSGYHKVAVAGATGNLGPAIVEQLVKANLSVTILSQSGNTSSLPSSVKTVKVDYKSSDSLISALAGQEAVVSLLPDHGSQPALIDAAIAAGVKLFIPSEFGADIDNAKAAALPLFTGKAITQKYLRERTDQISHTFVRCSLFLDWGLMVGFLAKKSGPTPIFDGGDVKISTTLLSDVGKAVVNSLNNPDATKNRAVYIQSTSISQNEVLRIAKEKNPDFKAEIEHVSTSDLLAKIEQAKKDGTSFEGNGVMDQLNVASEWTGGQKTCSGPSFPLEPC
ncbi:NAD(P)-binding protein [Zymoseptoria brevis]|uniref:NAD(P)-binding protein n=1 Tax=Zymoseptoria brevis TaxID=1047168 RepID=A0A0F4GBT9_9PEZI|nr:NAD(P)-binding protein [Zymoseptoria brevis]